MSVQKSFTPETTNYATQEFKVVLEVLNLSATSRNKTIDKISSDKEFVNYF